MTVPLSSTSISIEDSKKTVVALLDPSLSNCTNCNNSDKATASFRPVYWPDPHNNNENNNNNSSSNQRLYLLLEEETSTPSAVTVCEVQAFPSEYASYFVTPAKQKSSQSTTITIMSSPSLIVGRQSDLWCVSPMDPLFFILASPACQPVVLQGSGSSSSTSQWQPLDQLFTNLFSVSDMHQSIIQPHQTNILKQFYKALEIDEETRVYKFHPDSALEWLTKKQQRVQHVLEAQKQHANHNNNHNNNTSAFSSSFTVAEDLLTSNPKTVVSPPPSSSSSTRSLSADSETAPLPLQQQPPLSTERKESIQIVCSYLNKAWRQAFLQHLKVSDEDCGLVVVPPDATTTSKKRRVSSVSSSGSGLPELATDTQHWNHMMMTGTTTHYPSTTMMMPQPAKPAPPLTVQQKKLAKVNVKGMSKMTAFFKKK